MLALQCQFQFFLASEFSLVTSVHSWRDSFYFSVKVKLHHSAMIWSSYLDGEIVEAVNHFRYLGSEVMSSGRLDEELRTRIGRASATFGQLFKIWRSKISLKTKLRIYNAVVISTLLYGSETWATTISEEKRLDVFDNRCLRRILGVKWFHRACKEHYSQIKNRSDSSVLAS